MKRTALIFIGIGILFGIVGAIAGWWYKDTGEVNSPVIYGFAAYFLIGVVIWIYKATRR